MDILANKDVVYLEENSYEDRLNGGANMDVLARVELELAFASEKLLNLEMLVMEIARRATDIDPLTLDNESNSAESVEKAFELDILYGILNSEVKELDKLISSLQMDIENVEQKVYEEESADKVKVRLHNAMISLKQMQDLIADIRKESKKFEKAIVFSHDKAETTSEDGGCENGHMSSHTTMQTEDQQRNILQMLEKSIASELDLEKKLSDSTSFAEELKLKLHHLEQKSYFLEESIETITERMFAAENASEFFWGASKELINKFNTIQSALENVPEKMEEESQNVRAQEVVRNRTLSSPEFMALQNKVEELKEQLSESDSQLQLAKASAETSEEEQNMLHAELSTLGNTIKNLKDDSSRTETRAQNAEVRCMQLTQVNVELNKELSSFKSHGSDKASILERKLKESNTQLEHAKASVDAIVEQQSMLKSTMSDMEHMIDDLKTKVLKAETRAENSESKCTLLTDTNLELSEELSFLRGQVENLENSLQQANHVKMSTAKDIGIRTKVITDLVTKLSLERERLHLQIATLTKKNKISAQKSKGHLNEDVLLSQKVSAHDVAVRSTKLAEEIVTDSSSVQTEVKPTNNPPGEEVKITAPAEDESAAEDMLETVRSIEPSLFNWKYIFVAFLVLLAAFLVYLLYQEDA